MTRLTKLIEQTIYLISKQQESQKETAAIFDDILSFVEKNAATKPELQKERLLDVYELLSKRAESLNHYAQEDIDFLQDQLKALNAITQVKDPKAAAEMLETLIDEDEEVPEVDAFKEDIDSELEQSKIVLNAVVDDIKEAIERNDLHETEILIESLIESDDDMDDEDDGEDCDDEDEDEDDENPRGKRQHKGGCDDCSGGCKGCPVSGGNDEDIFSFMSKYDRDLNEDADVTDAKEDGGCCDDEDGDCDDEEDECCTK